MEIFKNGVKFALMGLPVGLIAGLVTVTVVVFVARLFGPTDPEMPMTLSIMGSCGGALVGSAMGALAGILGSTKR